MLTTAVTTFVVLLSVAECGQKRVVLSRSVCDFSDKQLHAIMDCIKAEVDPEVGTELHSKLSSLTSWTDLEMLRMFCRKNNTLGNQILNGVIDDLFNSIEKKNSETEIIDSCFEDVFQKFLDKGENATTKAGSRL